ncbi:hypothetical protein CgunFtcFv8_013279 [Champsocephalus gunnari]|uniref:Uncharacterized protein n=1 Tax=Champsocephalus gunnari TaxID=52237 RepID=A0AAN8E169_CHAGU|nr:hypothetical protein CgunFtcFv8_013279 [Champsocephalus gunnari]
MAVANAKPALNECDPKHCLPQIYKALLTASCLSCPNDPIQFLKNTLTAFQGHDSLQDVDWHKFVADAEQLPATTTLTDRTSDCAYMEPDDIMVHYGSVLFMPPIVRLSTDSSHTLRLK